MKLIVRYTYLSLVLLSFFRCETIETCTFGKKSVEIINDTAYNLNIYAGEPGNSQWIGEVKSFELKAFDIYISNGSVKIAAEARDLSFYRYTTVDCSKNDFELIVEN
jgi:hypothetical protein